MTDFSGRSVVGFESRRAPEMKSLIERHGGVAVWAPSMREVSVEGAPEEMQGFVKAVLAGRLDVVVFFTGVGVRGVVEAAAPLVGREPFLEALSSVPLVVARGPKPTRALRELGVSRVLGCPEPSTYLEIVAALDQAGPLSGKQVAVQEYGIPNAALYAALESRGASVLPISVYKYALPEDTRPLRAALHRLASGEALIALFTSRSQVEHALLVAAEEGIEAALRSALRSCLVGSIGPVCSEALRQEGIEPDVEPTLSRMGHLVKEAALQADAVLSAKAAARLASHS